MKNTKIFIIEGLDCANCAAKVERKLNAFEGIKEASVNFLSKKITLELEDNVNEAVVISSAIAMIKSLEPHTSIRPFQQGRKAVKSTNLNIKKCENEATIKAKSATKCCDSNCGCSGHSIEEERLAYKEIASNKELSQYEHGDEQHTHENENEHEHEHNHEHYHDHEHNHSHSASHDEDEEASHGHSHEHGGSVKKQLVKLGIGGAIFAVATIFNFSFYVGLFLYLIAFAIVGGEVVLRALRNIIHGEVFDENFLMSVATIGAFAIKQFPEGVAVMLFYQLGELFQDIAVNRSRKSIANLMDIRPDFATLKLETGEKRVSPYDVNIGDIIIVKPGERIPLDGAVIEGSSMVDTSALTGESIPRECEIGSSVLGGFINKNGVLTIKVEKIFEESTVSKILDLVENASNKKAPTENFITKFARYYTPSVVLAAVLLAILPPLFINDASFSTWIYRALSFLVVSCPCALVISIPLGFFGGIGGASKNGILIKGGNYLEALNSVETVVFDKTGTLTKGVFKVTKIATVAEFTESEVLEYAAFAESYSNHPIALSILNEYEASTGKKDLPKDRLNNYTEISGKGIRVEVDNKLVLAGNSKLMKENNIGFEEVSSIGSIIHVAIDSVYAGYIIISDEVKDDSANAIKLLKSAGVKTTVMLTGDIKAVGEKVGKELGLDKVFTELLPNQKVEKLEELFKDKSPKGKIVFVGDGINDAPVLARADIGIAMGGVGSDAAIEAADIVIMTDEPSKIAAAIRIAKRTKNIVWQNIIFALGVKLALLILVALGLSTMWEAVFGDVGVALIAVLNAMRAMKTLE